MAPPNRNQQKNTIPRKGASRSSYKLMKKTIYKKPIGERKNPNSLRFVIAIIINALHAGQQDIAAKKFRDHSGKYKAPGNKNEQRFMNDKALAGILNDTDYSHYWHLESISESLNIPTGALLIVSRLYSIIGKNEPGLTLNFIEGLKSFIACLEDMAELGDLTEENIHAIMKAFKVVHEAERQQPRLF